MDPPGRPHVKRRAASAQVSDSSPSPFPSTSKSTHNGSETRRPRTSQTVSIGWEEEQEVSRIRIGVAECVETKTVTTTTTTKRSYPPLLVRQQPLASLDPKEYPLALKDTPPELARFSFKLDGQMMDFDEGAWHNEALRFDPTPQPALNSRANGESSRKADSERPCTTKLIDDRAECLNNKQALLIHKRLMQGLPDVPPKSPTSIGGKPRKSQLISEHQARGGHVHSRKGDNLRRHGLGLLDSRAFPATPDMSELESANEQSHNFASYFEDTYTPRSGMSQNDSSDDAESQIDAISQELFPNAVATPPIAESDLEPVEPVNGTAASSSSQRPTVNAFVAQNASLPSPGLSPMYHGEDFDEHAGDEDHVDYSPLTQSGDSQETVDNDTMPCSPKPSSEQTLQLRSGEASPSNRTVPSVLNTRSMLETFDAMPEEMKTFMMYQFLRRCPKKTLHTVAKVVNPALQCDFLAQLPSELSLQIISFLDHRDLCRAAQVSKQWRSVIDSNESGWKDLFDGDGYTLPTGELQKAIKQGWGWQDPYGPEGFEEDLGPSDSDSFSAPRASEPKIEYLTGRKTLRSGTKRKRSSYAQSSDRIKRRTSTQELPEKSQDAKFHKSEGPMSAASAAAAAIPEPEFGLASLRNLHLYKSLYRRHHMLRRNWTSGKVEPRHFAFPAHPSHVITCLQFDDDKILTGSDDTLIHVYDTRTGKLRKKLEGHEGGVWALQYEGNVLVSGSTDRSVRVWDIEKGLCTQVFHGHTSTVRCLQILMPEPTDRIENGHPVMLPEKPLIITGSRDSQLRVWRLPEQGSKRYIQTGPPANDADCPYFVRTLSGHTHSVRAIAAHQDTLVSGSYDHTVRVWKISTGEILHRLLGHAMKVYSVVLDTKRNRCISGSMDTFVKIWSLSTGACLYTLEGHSSLVGLLDLRDERLVSAAADSSLRIWDPENGQCKSTLTAHSGAITCFQHDGQKVISGSDRTLKMWNVKTGECIKDLLTDLSGVWQVKFDERRCVAAVQRDNRTFVEVIDFGASRDGIPDFKRGYREVVELDRQTHLDDDRIEELDDSR